MCMKKSSKFATWLSEREASPYVLIATWREVKPCMVAIMEHEQAHHPSLIIVLCDSPRQFSRASAWVAEHDSTLSLHLCMNTDAAIEYVVRQDGGLTVNPLTGSVFSARKPNQPDTGKIAQKPLQVNNLSGQSARVQAARPPSTSEDWCSESSYSSSNHSSSLQSCGPQPTLPMTSNAQSMPHPAASCPFQGSASQPSLDVQDMFNLSSVYDTPKAWDALSTRTCNSLEYFLHTRSDDDVEAKERSSAHTRMLELHPFIQRASEEYLDWCSEDEFESDTAFPAARAHVFGSEWQLPHHVCEGKHVSPAFAPDSEVFTLNATSAAHNHHEFVRQSGKTNWDKIIPNGDVRGDLKVLELMLRQAMPDHYDE